MSADSTEQDKFKEHQSKAGKNGGKSRSEAKIRAARQNAAKARAKRFPQHQLMTVTPEQSNRPVQLPPQPTVSPQPAAGTQPRTEGQS